MDSEDSGEIRLTTVPVGDLELVVMSIPKPTADSLDELTRSEKEVVKQVLEGLSNAEIGAHRGVAMRTVANQLASVYEKLGVSSRFELAALLAGR